MGIGPKNKEWVQEKRMKKKYNGVWIAKNGQSFKRFVLYRNIPELQLSIFFYELTYLFFMENLQIDSYLNDQTIAIKLIGRKLVEITL